MAKETRAAKERREKIFKTLEELDEHSVYVVMVQHRASNPPHRAILLTGFKSGAYAKLVRENYEREYGPGELYSMEVVCKIYSAEELDGGRG